MKITNTVKSAKRKYQKPKTYNLQPKKESIKLLFIIILLIPFSSSAHWIAGYVENALDSTSPDGRTVRLWNPSNAQEIFATVGPSGQSGTSNVYMADCELLATPCQVGDTLNLTIVNDGSGYTAKNIIDITITGAGFDIAENLTINTPPTINTLTVEDSLSSPENEIDLTPATTTRITCQGIIEDQEGASSISTIHAAFFHSTSSFGLPDDNNDHYTNSTCHINTSYGNSNQAEINCTFQIEYYARPGSWQCQINATDNYSSSTTSSDSTTVNTLLAIGVNSPMSFGEVELNKVSQETQSNITNYGNVQINLTLSGYGSTPLDGNSMECGAVDIPVDYMKFNLTSSNSSELTMAQFNTIYQNLTNTPTTYPLELNSRQDDILNEANKTTYWRVFIPNGINTYCEGNIVFAATQS